MLYICTCMYALIRVCISVCMCLYVDIHMHVHACTFPPGAKAGRRRPVAGCPGAPRPVANDYDNITNNNNGKISAMYIYIYTYIYIYI